MLPPKPITLKYFKELLKTLDIPASVDVEYAVRNVIAKAKKSEISKDQIKRLKYLLNVYLPANLTFQIITTAEADVDLNLFVGVAENSLVEVISEPRLVTYASSKALSYVGSVTSQTLSTTSSRALIKSEVETSLSNYTGTTKPQIYTEVTFYPKGVEGLNV